MKELIILANIAKNTGNYHISNYIIGVALHLLHRAHDDGVDVSIALSMDTEYAEFSFQAWNDALLEWDYYGLLYIESGDDAVCIPIPRLSDKAQQFLLDVKGAIVYGHVKHNRRHYSFDDKKKRAAAKDIERRITERLPEWQELKKQGMAYLDLFDE